MNPPHALLEPCWVPWDVIVDHQPSKLQIDAFTGRIGADQVLRPTLVSWLAKILNLRTTLFESHTAVNTRNTSGESKALEPPYQEILRVTVLSENDRFFMDELRISQDLAQFRKLRLFAPLVNALRKDYEFRHLFPFNDQLGERCSDHAAEQFVFGSFVLFDTILGSFLIRGCIIQQIARAAIHPQLIASKLILAQIARSECLDQPINLLQAFSQRTQ